MLPQNRLAWGLSRSSIRELAAYGAKRKAEIGAENVYDFSLGNPNVPVPSGGYTIRPCCESPWI